MKIEGVEIEDTFAEAFSTHYASFLITAVNEKWVREAAREVTGYATSLIACTAEAGVESFYSPQETPDNRAGAGVLLFAPKKRLEKELIFRIGQCVLTSPTTRVFSLYDGEPLEVGYKLKFFGDGYEEIKQKYGREMVSIPIMMGEFEIERNIKANSGVAGGNFLIIAKTQASALLAAEAAVEAISKVRGVITPFPGGVVASGSKVGSRKYRFMHATTNEAFCPTLKDKTESKLPSEAKAVAEVVINGISEEKVREAMAQGIKVACTVDGVLRISAGNYGGNLGKVHIYLRELF